MKRRPAETPGWRVNLIVARSVARETGQRTTLYRGDDRRWHVGDGVLSDDRQRP